MNKLGSEVQAIWADLDSYVTYTAAHVVRYLGANVRDYSQLSYTDCDGVTKSSEVYKGIRRQKTSPKHNNNVSVIIMGQRLRDVRATCTQARAIRRNWCYLEITNSNSILIIIFKEIPQLCVSALSLILIVSTQYFRAVLFVPVHFTLLCH